MTAGAAGCSLHPWRRDFMTFSAWAILVSLVAASLRAALLLRASTKVEAVNTAVLTTLAGGRGRELADLLSSSGPALYLGVARSISLPLDKISASDAADVRKRLERDAQAALMVANRSLSRSAWLDAVALVGIALAGAAAVTGEYPSLVHALGLVAATLLWLSNLYGARSLATRMFAGAMALVDGLVEGREQIGAANTNPT
jgi:hypothetical protein